MIIFNLNGLLQVVVALFPSLFLVVLAIAFGSPWLFLFAIAAFGIFVAGLDLLWRRATAEKAFGAIDALSPRRGGHVFFLPMWLWGSGWSLMFVTVLVTSLLGGETEPGSPDAKAFGTANGQISVRVEGPTAFGNTDDAVAMAEQFELALTLFRVTSISGEDDGFSLSGGHFLTYCHADADSVVFLVHVPDLRDYDASAKVALNSAAWSAAQGIVGDRPVKLGVGLRGALIYDAVLIGDANGKPHRGEREDLYAFFAPAPIVESTAAR